MFNSTRSKLPKFIVHLFLGALLYTYHSHISTVPFLKSFYTIHINRAINYGAFFGSDITTGVWLGHQMAKASILLMGPVWIHLHLWEHIATVPREITKEVQRWAYYIKSNSIVFEGQW